MSSLYEDFDRMYDQTNNNNSQLQQEQQMLQQQQQQVAAQQAFGNQSDQAFIQQQQQQQIEYAQESQALQQQGQHQQQAEEATQMQGEEPERDRAKGWGTTIEEELDFFLHDHEDEEDPLKEQIEQAKRKAQEFMHIVKSKFPNRYFILKRITQNMEHWQTCCLNRGFVIITDDSYAKKLQNCYEVI